MERITSRKNALCLHIRRLSASAEYRRACGEFVFDSPKLLKEALLWQSGQLRTVVYTQGARLPALPEHIRVVEVPGEVMETLSPAKTPQGVLAVCAMASEPLPEKLEGRHYVVLDGIQDPGNVGTILRTADAFWADGVFLVNACADLYSPKTIRATMGALFRCPVWQCGVRQLKKLLDESDIPLYGAALEDDTRDAREVDYSRAALAIGSEGRGLSAELMAVCTQAIRIPMSVHCESLNARGRRRSPPVGGRPAGDDQQTVERGGGVLCRL